MIIFDINSINHLIPILIGNAVSFRNELFFNQDSKLYEVLQFIEHTVTIEENGSFINEVTGYSMRLSEFQEVLLKVNGTELVVISNTLSHSS
ncbi:hypothetical protein L4D00_16260 [Photobacterium swingsii]|uniref:hypothetical protein n=1 Tax=Photobacterium swingsii TaxID=680026 RepID=UPI003D119828